MTDTRTPVDQLEGRELDAAVAREVFGLDVRGPDDYHLGYWIHGESPFAYDFRSTDGDRGGDINGVPRFSEEWGPAGRVVERMRHYDPGTFGSETGFVDVPVTSVSVRFLNGDTTAYGESKWVCRITRWNEDDGTVVLGVSESGCAANDLCSASSVICRAALKAVRRRK